MKIKYKIGLVSEMIIETNQLITSDELMNVMEPKMVVKEPTNNLYKILECKNYFDIIESEEEIEEIMEV